MLSNFHQKRVVADGLCACAVRASQMNHRFPFDSEQFFARSRTLCSTDDDLWLQQMFLVCGSIMFLKFSDCLGSYDKLLHVPM